MKVVYIFESKNIDEVENCVIAQLKKYRYKKRKDFYQINKTMLKTLIKDCEKFTLRFKKGMDKQKNKNNKDTQEGGAKEENLFIYIEKK